jgi:hypothetical protein
MTPEEVEAIRVRVAAATPGSWYLLGSTPHVPGTYSRFLGERRIAVVLALRIDVIAVRDADAIFLTKAREDVPKLLAERDRLVAENEELRNVLRTLTDVAEDYASSDPDMPSHADTERRFEEVLDRARAAVSR